MDRAHTLQHVAQKLSRRNGRKTKQSKAKQSRAKQSRANQNKANEVAFVFGGVNKDEAKIVEVFDPGSQKCKKSTECIKNHYLIHGNQAIMVADGVAIFLKVILSLVQPSKSPFRTSKLIFGNF